MDVLGQSIVHADTLICNFKTHWIENISKLDVEFNTSPISHKVRENTPIPTIASEGYKESYFQPVDQVDLNNHVLECPPIHQ